LGDLKKGAQNEPLFRATPAVLEYGKGVLGAI
jgi:hypothetical protein